LAPLAEAGYRSTIAAHFNNPSVIANARSGEFGAVPKATNVFGLPINLLWVQDQDPDLVEPLIQQALSFPFLGVDDRTGATRRNLAFQLHSLRQLHKLISVYEANKFDAFLLIRPDLEYLDRLDVNRDLSGILDGTTEIVTPSWQQWDGLNDRFCFATRKGAEVYANRGSLIGDFTRQNGWIHSERLLEYAIAEAGLSNALTDMRARRIRANGSIHAEWGRLGFQDRLRSRFNNLVSYRPLS
jgi:hypothetical protein